MSEYSWSVCAIKIREHEIYLAHLDYLAAERPELFDAALRAEAAQCLTEWVEALKQKCDVVLQGLNSSMEAV